MAAANSCAQLLYLHCMGIQVARHDSHDQRLVMCLSFSVEQDHLADDESVCFLLSISAKAMSMVTQWCSRPVLGTEVLGLQPYA